MKLLAIAALASGVWATTSQGAVFNYVIERPNTPLSDFGGLDVTLDEELLGFGLDNVTFTLIGFLGAPDAVRITSDGGDRLFSLDYIDILDYYQPFWNGRLGDDPRAYIEPDIGFLFDEDDYFVRSFGAVDLESVSGIDLYRFDVFIGDGGIATGYRYTEGGNLDVFATQNGCSWSVNLGPTMECASATEVITTVSGEADAGADTVAPVPLPAGGWFLGAALLTLIPRKLRG